MGWNFWKRDSTDPLAKVLFKEYRLNLLAIPREKASVGDLYIREKDSSELSIPGNIANFLEPSLQLPPTETDASMADVSNKWSEDISANLGLEFLQNFLKPLLGPVSAKIRASFEDKKTRNLKLQFGSLSKDVLDIFWLGNSLKDHELRKDNALYAVGRRYYVVCGVARAQSITLIAQDDKNEKVDLDAQVTSMVNGTGTGSVQTSNAKEITFKGNQKLAFGVELYELRYDDRDGRLVLEMPTGPLKARGPPPSYVGTDESMFFDLS